MTKDRAPLFVPIEVHALVVNEQVQKGEGFRRWQPSFDNANRHAPVEPEPLAETGHEEPPGLGVHLRWQLPAALCRAAAASAHAPDGRAAFPRLPNRWLVLRYGDKPDGTSRGLHGAWLVESDYRGLDGLTRLPTKGDSGKVSTVGLGRVIDLSTSSTWKEPGLSTVALTAETTGLPTFAAFQPYHRGVFSLHDSLGLFTADRRTTHSYLVAGWYAGQDVPGTWSLADFRRYGWDLAGQAALPTEGVQSLYVGTARQVPWNPKAALPSDRARPRADDVMAAVGSSGVDAFTAVLGHRDTLERLRVKDPPHLNDPNLNRDTVRALHHGILDALAGDVDNTFRFDQFIHQAAFTARPAGHWWTLTDRGEPKKPLTPQVLSDLTTLNTHQGRYEQQAADLRAQQHTLLYWAHLAALDTYSTPPQLPPKDIATARDALAGQVTNSRKSVEKLRAALPDPSDPADPRLPTSLLDRVVAAPRPAYHRPADPVVLLLGAHPGAGAATAPGPLRCRWSTHMPKPHSPRPGFMQNMPAGLLSAMTELKDIDTTGKSSGTLQPQYGTAAWTDQPWQPLYLEWRIEYHPVPLNRVANGTQVPNWVFDGSDYHRVEEWEPPTVSDITCSGRQLLGPHLSRTLLANIDRYRTSHPGLKGTTADKQLDKLVTAVTTIDPLSQALSGLTDQLAQRRPPAGTPPQGKLAEAIDRVPDHRATPGALPSHGSWPPSKFQDLRAGHFLFTDLEVIDVFGRTLKIITPENWQLERLLLPPDLSGADDTVVDGFNRTVRLRPRLPQPARTRFDFVDATDDTNAGAAANPLCGWVWPNYVDSSLLFFTPDGQPLVSLVPAAGAANGVAVLPLPGFPHPDLKNITDPRLRHLTTLIDKAATASPSSAFSFATLYAAIHRLLPTITPHHPEGAQHHASLIGRPLALARVRLGIDLDGPPLTDPSWEYVHGQIKEHKAPPAPSFTRHPWPVRLGEADRLSDALIGFYAYEQSDLSSFAPLQAAGPKAQVTCTPTAATRHLTLLMDPYATVHAATGILPVAELRLPDALTRTPLSRLRISYRLGPHLAGRRDGHLVMPLPPASTGTWVWAATRTSTCNWSYQPLIRADATARMPGDPPALYTGHLHCQMPQEHQP
ncbi:MULTISPECIES: hypothetical protein [Streptomyces]|uniref:hypothetical protein n=1 Tax=Streptomyces TaxID=1883 RepID=UPI0004CCAD47|nr:MULTISPECIES: hypothetical protein [Streptomyces]KOT52707.1 hypothetical protein ADK43_30075 [Streptomyces rimosus subsp. rimosus]